MVKYDDYSCNARTLNILDYHALTTKEVGDHRITCKSTLNFKMWFVSLSKKKLHNVFFKFFVFLAIFITISFRRYQYTCSLTISTTIKSFLHQKYLPIVYFCVPSGRTGDGCEYSLGTSLFFLWLTNGDSDLNTLSMGLVFLRRGFRSRKASIQSNSRNNRKHECFWIWKNYDILHEYIVI